MSKYIKNNYQTILFITFACLFLGHAYCKFYKPVTTENLSIVDQGDGIGTISGNYSIANELKNRGITVLFNDLFTSDQVGPKDVVKTPTPFSFFWKSNVLLLSNFFSPEGIYDIIALIAYILSFITGFLLLKSLSISNAISLILALALANLDNFYTRLTCHMQGLGFHAMVFILVFCSIKFAKNFSIKNSIFLALINLLNFQVNEYYGYYGLIFSFSCYFGYNLKFNLNTFKKITLNAGISLTALMILLIIFYPNLIGSKFLPFLASTSVAKSITDYTHIKYEFTLYTAGNFLSTFKLSDFFGISFFSNTIFNPRTHEVSYRIGFILPVAVFLYGMYLKLKKQSLAFLNLKILAFPTILIVLFCAPTAFPLTFVRITRTFAPMFRVSSRALIYLDVILVILFALCLEHFFKNYISKSTNNFKKTILSILMITVLFLGFLDVTNGKVFTNIQGTPLPNTEIYKELAKLPNDGMVLEIPYYFRGKDPVELNYIYNFNQTVHHKHLFNDMFDLNEKYSFLKEINHATEASLLAAKANGIKYVVINKTNFTNFDKFEQSNLFDKLSSDNLRVLLKFKD